MQFTIYQLLWFFLIYSVAGWVIGTSLAVQREKRFIDVGFLFGPFCPSYGVGALAFAVFLGELKFNLIFLFLGGVILSFLVTILSALVLEKIFHRKWWDYSHKKVQFGGYVNIPYTVVWGIAAVLCIYFINPFFSGLITYIPKNIGNILLLIFYIVALLDFIGTSAGILAVHSRINKIAIISGVSDNLQKAADLLGAGLTGWLLKHLEKAHPNLSARELLKIRQEEKAVQKEAAASGVFASGCGFYKLVSLFLLGAFLGDIVETIFCYLTTGELMSRSSVVYGPFSLIWGLACYLLTQILYQYRNRSDSFIFLFGTVLGGAYEYICSVFTEIVFGTIFWDYSGIPFNLGGRINLLFCFFWGIAAVAWMKFLYPRLSRLIEKLPKKIGVPFIWIMILFMIVNAAISGLALNRYSERHANPSAAGSVVTQFLDEHFDDARMERIYPNAKAVE